MLYSEYTTHESSMKRYMLYAQLGFIFLLFSSLMVIAATTASFSAFTVYIRADGTISPIDVPISQDGSYYTFIDNLNAASIIVQKSGVTIDGNGHFLNGTGFIDEATALFLENITDVTVRNLKISNFYFGIHAIKCSNLTITHNSLIGNAYGIYPNFSNNSIILSNTIMENFGGGIYLTNSFNFTVEGNLVGENFGYGMRVTSTRNSTFFGNIVANNDGGGIHMQFSSKNTVYHNNFINNTYDGVNEGAANVWNSSYPEGGNFWDDYRGLDIFGGPNQKIPGPDGIGDTPYVINGENADHYPLMRPLILNVLGDINNDGIVNVLDVAELSMAYGSKQGESNWNLLTDLSPPYGTIDILDVVACTSHNGQTFLGN